MSLLLGCLCLCFPISFSLFLYMMYSLRYLHSGRHNFLLDLFCRVVLHDLFKVCFYFPIGLFSFSCYVFFLWLLICSLRSARASAVEPSFDIDTFASADDWCFTEDDVLPGFSARISWIPVPLPRSAISLCVFSHCLPARALIFSSPFVAHLIAS
jgi:hypothetical protein